MKNRILSLAMFSGLLAVSTGCPTAPGPDPIPATPKITRFTATPALVKPGEKVSLVWEVTDATAVTITDARLGAVPGVDDAPSGTVMVAPEADALYVLVATNARGAKATAIATARLQGADAAKVVFAAFPAQLTEGQTATLIWSAPGATTVSITPTGAAALDLKGQLSAGTIEVNPAAAETTYALMIDGAAAQSITVTRAPAIDDFTVSKKLMQPGDQVTIGWKVTNATKVSLASISRGTLTETTAAATIVEGSYVDTIPNLPQNGARVTWVLTATGPGGSTSRTLAGVIGRDPVLDTVTAPAYAKAGGTYTVKWTSTNADAVQVRAGSTVLFETASPGEAAAGSVVLASPATEQTLTVAAKALAVDVEVTKDVTIKPVGSASITTFTVTPAVVPDGGAPVTITWNVAGARTLRVLQDGELTVVAQSGPAAESGTQTAYVNRLASTFTLTADNTIDPPVTGAALVTVSTIAELGLADGGTPFEGGAPLDLATAVGTQLFGLPHGDVVTTAAAATFDDIAATGTRLVTPSEDSVASFSPPSWETFFYSRRLASALSVSTNGWMSFTRTTSARPTPPTTFPATTAPANLYAPFWTDLEFTPGANDSGLFWQLKGTAPNQTLIVQWNKLRVKGAPTSAVTFQARITQVGTVTFEYQALTDLPSTGVLVTGLQGVPGTGLTASATAGSSLQFFGPKSSPVAWPGTQLPVTAWAAVGSGYARVTLSKYVRSTDLRITEVMYAPVGSVPSGEWFELHSSASLPIDLVGTTIDFGGGNTHTIATSLTVPPGGYVVLGQSASLVDNDGVVVNYAYGASLTMPDAAGTLSLNVRGVPVSATWSAGGPGQEGRAGVFELTRLITTTTTQHCAATATYGTATPTLQRGTPGAGSSCFFVGASRLPVSFFDISGTGTRITSATSGNDSQVYAVDLAAAPVTLRGQVVNAITVSTNGWLSTTPTTSGSTNSGDTTPTASAPIGVIAPFWDDLVMRSPGRPNAGIFTKRVAAGEDPSNPGPHWIIQWNQAETYDFTATNDVLDFQVKLFDTGAIEFHYATMTSGSSANGANGNSATIWVENAAGTAAVAFGVDEAKITSNMALRFTP